MYRLMADLILVIHALFVAFVVLGLFAVLSGKYLRWSWVRNLRFRLFHLAAIGVVNMEQVVIADVDLDALTQNRINGTTIPLYDKRREVYQDPVEIVSALSGVR